MNSELLLEAENNLKTIHDFVRFSATQFEHAGLFYGHGTDNAWDEAAYLILHALNLPPDSPSAVFNARLVPSEKKYILNRIQERIERNVPAAYITKEAWFSGLSFYVDERVLVPRSPIAELIENEFSPWLDGMEVTRIADVCTGSGCIATALAFAFPDAQVDATDISDDALDVAKINVERYGLEQQVTLTQTDLMTDLLENRYDLIVSNPPYVDAAAMDALPLEYRKEPVLGLEAGIDGLACVIPLLQQAQQCLNPGGILVIELGHSQAALEALYPDVPFIWIDFENGGEGVFVLDYESLQAIPFN